MLSVVLGFCATALMGALLPAPTGPFTHTTIGAKSFHSGMRRVEGCIYNAEVGHGLSNIFSAKSRLFTLETYKTLEALHAGHAA